MYFQDLKTAQQIKNQLKEQKLLEREKILKKQVAYIKSAMKAIETGQKEIELCLEDNLLPELRQELRELGYNVDMYYEGTLIYISLPEDAEDS